MHISRESNWSKQSFKTHSSQGIDNKEEDEQQANNNRWTHNPQGDDDEPVAKSIKHEPLMQP